MNPFNISLDIANRIDNELKNRNHDEDCTLYIEPDKGKSCDCIINLLINSKDLILSLEEHLYLLEVDQSL